MIEIDMTKRSPMFTWHILSIYQGGSLLNCVCIAKTKNQALELCGWKDDLNHEIRSITKLGDCGLFKPSVLAIEHL